MKVLVTGGAGFIGRHVCRVLTEADHTPVVMDIAGQPYTGDVLNRAAVFDHMSKVDGWIHLAATLGTQETIEDPAPVAEVNVIGSINVFDAAAALDKPGVYVTVGNHWMNNPYSITKNAVERFATMYNETHGTSINVVRPMNAYGPGQSMFPPFGTSKVRKITPSFVCRALTGMPIQIYGDGKQVSDMVYVGDVAGVIVQALGEARDVGPVKRVIEVGPDNHNTVLDVAYEVIRVTKSPSIIEHLPMRPGEEPDAVVSAKPVTLSLVGMDARSFVPLRTGLYATAQYFRRVLVESGWEVVCGPE